MLQTISFETDMEDGVKMQRLGRLFASGDKAAHTFKIKVKGADLSGYSADGYMIRATNDTVLISAIVDGDIVIATLPEACYIVPGSFSLIFCVKNENERTAVFWSVGTITRSRTETIIDTEKIREVSTAVPPKASCNGPANNDQAYTRPKTIFRQKPAVPTTVLPRSARCTITPPLICRTQPRGTPSLAF